MLRCWILLICLLVTTPFAAGQETPPRPANLEPLVGVDSPLQPTERIVFVGDSITMQGGFVELISQGLQSNQAQQNIRVSRHGLNGGRVPDMSAGKTPWGEIKPYAEILATDKPSILVLYLGINDVMHSPGTSLEDFESGLTDMLKAAQAAGAAVVLATPAVNGENIDPAAEDQKKLANYTEITRQVAEQHGATLCDLRQAFVDYLQQHNIAQARSGLLTYDGVHMSAEGNRLIAELMAAALAKAAQARQAK
jgi:lysophospholipase L1-like esterase